MTEHTAAPWWGRKGLSRGARKPSLENCPVARVSLPKPGMPHTCHSSPCEVSACEGRCWLDCREGGLGLRGGGPGWPASTWDHLCWACLGPSSFELQESWWAALQRWCRRASVLTTVSSPICSLLEAPFSAHCRPICEPALQGELGCWAGWSAGWAFLGAAYHSAWSSASLQPPGYQGCFQLPFFSHPHRHLCVYSSAPSLCHPLLQNLSGSCLGLAVWSRSPGFPVSVLWACEDQRTD